MKPTIDEQWAAVQAFYGRHYKDEKKVPIRFKHRLPDDKILELYQNMRKVLGSFKEFYFHNEILWGKLQSFRGMVGEKKEAKVIPIR